jgi:phage FluMu protein Com
MGIIMMQLVCDTCNKVLLEKSGEQHLLEQRFPITEEEAQLMDRDHRGHECHIEAVEKYQ